MELDGKNFFWLLIKLIAVSYFVLPFFPRAHALNETFEVYESPQALSMGKAFTADAQGYSALFYNPAGLAKASKKEWEIIPLSLEGMPSMQGLGRILAAKTLGIFRLFGEMQKNAGKYTYFRFNSVPAATRRNMGIAGLVGYRYAANSDGTNIDINAGTDIGTTFGGALNFAGNIVKLGLAAKILIRDELKGTFAHSEFTSDIDTTTKMREGIGIGGDIGMLITLPSKYLPTLGVVWKDVLDTHFTGSHIFNKRAQGAPEKIRQSFNAGISIHPAFGKGLQSIIAVEFRHIEKTTWSLRKRLHIGGQLITQKNFYLWAGVSQLYPTFGLGWRVRGGALEVGSYAEDIGTTSTSDADRRLMMRYTVEF